MNHSNNLNWRPPVLETKRLFLRALELTDAPAIFSYARNPKVAEYTLWDAHQSVSDSQLFIETVAHTNYARGMPEPLGIILKKRPNEIIGTVGCFWVIQPYGSMELAYALAEPYWGQGLIKEAAEALLTFAFTEYRVNRIQARCKQENTQSERVMTKLGMTFEGIHRSEVFHRGRFWNLKYYSILKEEWHKRQQDQ